MAKAVPVDTLPDFKGSLVWVFVSVSRPSKLENVLVEYPEFGMEGSRLCLLGRRSENVEGQWVSDRRITVPWSAVSHFIVFSSRDEYFDRCREHARPKRSV
jgi:hypothetical protein